MNFTKLAYTVLLLVGLMAQVVAQSDPSLEIEQVRTEDPSTGTTLGTGTETVRVDPSESTDGRVTAIAEPSSDDVSSVRFVLDGDEIRVDNDAPFTITFRVATDGSFILEPAPSDVTSFRRRIADGSDDAEEFLQASSTDAERFPGGYTYTRSSDLELGRDPDHATQAIGLRFPDVPVPPDATIVRTEIVFVAREAGTESVGVEIRGLAQQIVDPFVQDEDGLGSRGVTSRPLSQAVVPWSLEAEALWTQGERYATPDLAAIVQEALTAPSWSEGGALGFVLLPSPAAGEGFRRAFTADANPDVAPELRLSFRMESVDRIVSRGSHSLTVVPHAEPFAQGAAGEPLALRLELGTSSEPVGDADHALGQSNAYEDVVRSRFALEPIDGVRAHGFVLISTYGDNLSILSVLLDEEPTEPVRVEWWHGNCQARTEVVAELAPYRPGTGSITPLELGAGTLRIGSYSVWVMSTASDSAIACASIGGTP